MPHKAERKGCRHRKLSENIKTLSRERNLRQEQLAEAMGVSTASVSKWETGQCAPELTVLTITHRLTAPEAYSQVIRLEIRKL